jgi:hypothetical protein
VQPRLSMMTMGLGLSVGTRNCSTSAFEAFAAAPQGRIEHGRSLPVRKSIPFRLRSWRHANVAELMQPSMSWVSEVKSCLAESRSRIEAVFRGTAARSRNNEADA